MDIGDLLDPQAIIPRVNATSKRHALSVVADVAARLYGLNAAEVAAALNDREQDGSTGVGFGVGLPHGRLRDLDRTRGLFARLETPVPFDSVDDQPVDLIFVLLGPLDAGITHLRALSRVSRALRRADLRQHLRQARTQDALYALLSQDIQSTAA